MALRSRTPRPAPAKKAPDPRLELVRAMIEAGQIVASACGVCGATVAAEDPEAVQTYSTRWVGSFRDQRRAWRYHRVCKRAAEHGSAAVLALMLAPSARPVRITQAIAEVAERIGVPLRYEEIEGTRADDAGRKNQPFTRAGRSEMNERRAAVAQREQELTVPVPHTSGWPCAVCGRSHELGDAWGMFEGRPVCGSCSRMAAQSSPRVPGNRRLWEYARDVMLAEARHLLSARAYTWPLQLAREMASYRPLGPDERREPWAYVADLPVVPLTEEEQMAARVAELEKRLIGAAA